VYVDSVVNPSIIDLLDGSVMPITDFTTTDSSVIFDSLPISDYPYCLAFNHTTGIAEEQERTIQEAGLCLFPNPFREKVDITFQIPLNNYAVLEIYDIAGRLVKNFDLKSEISNLQPEVSWSGADNTGQKLPSGVYFLKFHVGDCKETRKLLLIR